MYDQNMSCCTKWTFRSRNTQYTIRSENARGLLFVEPLFRRTCRRCLILNPPLIAVSVHAETSVNAKSCPLHTSRSDETVDIAGKRLDDVHMTYLVSTRRVVWNRL